MRIAICGSMTWASEMTEIARALQRHGYTCLLPSDTLLHMSDPDLKDRYSADPAIKGNLIKDHYGKIGMSDAIVIVNPQKNGIANYIGPNTFLEIGFAFVLEKPIFLLYGIPANDWMQAELIAMQPISCNGDADQVIDYLKRG